MPSNVSTSDFVGTRTILTDVIIIIFIITCILLYSFLHQTVLMYLVVVMPLICLLLNFHRGSVNIWQRDSR